MTTTGTYQAYWSNAPTAQTVTTAVKSSFKWDNYTNYSYDSGKCVSTLLNTGNWTSFRNTTYADYAIGTPTLEMFVESWNQIYSNQKIYCNNTSETGYYCGTNNEPTSINTNLSNKSGYSNSLYFPYTTETSSCDGYWLSSPSGTNDSCILRVTASTGYIGHNHYTKNNLSIRPVVRIKLGFCLTKDDNLKGSCDFGLKSIN